MTGITIIFISDDSNNMNTRGESAAKFYLKNCLLSEERDDLDDDEQGMLIQKCNDYVKSHYGISEVVCDEDINQNLTKLDDGNWVKTDNNQSYLIKIVGKMHLRF